MLLLHNAVGQYEAVSASRIKPGDKLAVVSQGSAGSGRAAGPAVFTAAVVTAVQRVMEPGAYLPAVNTPFIIADGVVTPL